MNGKPMMLLLLALACGGSEVKEEWRPLSAYLAPSEVPLVIGTSYRIIFTIGDTPDLRPHTLGYPCVVTDTNGITSLRWGVWRDTR